VEKMKKNKINPFYKYDAGYLGGGRPPKTARPSPALAVPLIVEEGRKNPEAATKSHQSNRRSSWSPVRAAKNEVRGHVLGGKKKKQGQVGMGGDFAVGG